MSHIQVVSTVDDVVLSSMVVEDGCDVDTYIDTLRTQHSTTPITILVDGVEV